MGKINRILILLLVFVGILVGLMAWYINANQDEIINKVIAELNQRIDTPVEAEKIDISILTEFPSVTLKLRNVKIHQSSEVLNDYLCIASDLFISIRLLDLLKETINIEKVAVSGATINLARGTDGKPNYLILTRKDSTGNDPGSFDIENLTLSEVEIGYSDLGRNVFIRAMTDHQAMGLQVKKGDVLLRSKGRMELKSLSVDGTRFLENTGIEEDIKLTYKPANEELLITEASVFINGFPYDISGHMETAPDIPVVDFKFKSSRSDIQSIVSLLPENYRNYLWPYKSRGTIYFNGRIHGYAGKGKYPSIEINFGAQDASVYHPEYRTDFEHLNFRGRFSNGNNQSLRTSKLEIKDLKGLVKGKELTGRLTMKDFRQLYLDADISSEFDLPSFLDIFPSKLIKNSRGHVLLNLNFNGPVQDIEKNIRSNLVKISGDILMKDVSLITRKPELNFDNLNGKFIFNNHDLAIEDFTGKLGSSDFQITGFFKNVVAWLFVKNYPVRIEANMYSRLIDLNELLKIDFDTTSAGRSEKDQYYFSISNRLDVRFRTSIENVYLQRFHGRNIQADLAVNNQIAIIEKMKMDAMGGELELSGSVMSRNRQMREVLVDGRVKSLRIDSIFYVFKDFKQEFMKSEHLYGNISADVNTYLMLDRKLKFYPDELKVFADARIEDGQLNNFNPMQKLKQYVRRDNDLSRLRFGDLHNEIEVKNRVIYIPEMRVESNVSKLYIMGTHTFNQEIDYHFHIPLNQKEKRDADERFGRVEADDGEGASLFLQMTGTADQYKVSLDTDAVKREVREDIKKEGEELKKAFRKKDSTDIESIELEDEYIDY